MSCKPLVSVIINFLDAEQFLQEAIASVFAQTYTNWELLLVDDGSTDASTEIALQCARRHPAKVRYLQHDGHQNRGASASRNLGSSKAKGEYIAFLDADDVWLPRKLEEQVEILEAQPEAVMVYGVKPCWFSWTGDPDDVQRDFVIGLGVQPNTLIKPPRLITLFLQKESVIPSMSGVLVRREAVQRVGGSEEAFQSVFDDRTFYAKLGLEAPVFVSDRCWYWYRHHPNQRCYITLQTGQHHPARLEFLNWLQEFLAARGVQDGELWAALRRELWRYRHPRLHRLMVQTMGSVMGVARLTIPAPLRRWLWARYQGREYIPPAGYVRFGNLRRLRPISHTFGSVRGVGIYRYFIEGFLGQHRDDIQGHVLEMGDGTYTRRFGGKRVIRSDVLHTQHGNPNATIVADLTCADAIPSGTFDCIILPQTLHCIYDVRAALRHVYRILKPGGVLLATLPGISQISRCNVDGWGDYWRFTTLSARRLFEAVFPATGIEVTAYGNVLAAIAVLHGLAAEELRPEELDYGDLDYEVLITVRAVKPEATS